MIDIFLHLLHQPEIKFVNTSQLNRFTTVMLMIYKQIRAVYKGNLIPWPSTTRSSQPCSSSVGGSPFVWL